MIVGVPLAHPDNPPTVGAADLTVNPLFTRKPLAVPRDRLPDSGIVVGIAP
jgi:glutamate decarboxylase